jgi:DNA-directed RNA polymerase subunit H (RpoH/RPB5)
MEGVVSLFGSTFGGVHADGMKVLSRVVATATEMLLARGLSVRGETDALAAIEAGRPVLTSEPTGEEGGGAARVGVDVFVCGEAKVGVKFARAAIDRSGGRGVVFVSVDGPTPFTRRECEAEGVQFFNAKQLYYNVTRHALVPRHEVVDAPPDGVSTAQLPHLLASDPVAQYYAWPTGTVVRVWRGFGGEGRVPYFRLVASSPNN